MTRANRILAVLLVVQLVVAALVFLPRTIESGPQEAGPLFPDLEAGQVVSLTVTDGEGDSVHLARRGGEWVFAEADDFPTREDSVPDLLDKIAALKTDRLVTETAGSHKRLKVAGDEFERRVDLELEDGTHLRLYIGSSPSYGVAHVRADGQNEVYLVSDLSAQDVGADASAWAERIFFTVPRDDVEAMTLENDHGLLEFQRAGETWDMAGLEEGEVLDQVRIGTLLGRVTSVTLLEPLGKEARAEYGLDEPSAVVHLQTGDKTYTLTIGAPDAEGSSYVFHSSESPYYVRVNGFSVQDLVDWQREDFLQQPTPTPTPLAALTSTPEPATYPGPTPTP